MNDFEKYIQTNKEQLDTEAVQDQTWLAIENKLLKKKNTKIIRMLRWISSAAAVSILAILGLQLFFQPSSDPTDILAANGLESEPFVQQVGLKREALKGMEIPVNRKEDFDLLLNQLEFLDRQYQDYLQYVKINGYQEFIGQQILNYYKTKIELLEKIQNEIQKINDYEKKYNKKSAKVQLSI